MSDTPEPKNLLEALTDIARLTQERDALRNENNGLHEWAHKDRETLAGYRKLFAELRAQCDKLETQNAQLRANPLVCPGCGMPLEMQDSVWFCPNEPAACTYADNDFEHHNLSKEHVQRLRGELL